VAEGKPPPSLAGLAVAADKGAWRAAGFEVSEDGVAAIGTVRVTLAGADAGRRILHWALRDLSSTELDGLPTEREGPPPAARSAVHPNGAVRIDHVVAFSPDLERSTAALRAAGLDFRRLREGPTPAGAQRQAFFRVGEAILEVVEHPPGTPAAENRDAPAGFYGLALATADLDATARTLGPLLGDVRDAVQPGRRIATVRREAALGLPVAFMSAQA
jgi:Glyoxalase-like domain